MTNYSSIKKNKDVSEKPKRPEKIEKVTTGSVQIKPKSHARKLAEMIVPGDVTTVRNYIFQDVIIPTIKSSIYEIGSNALSMFLFPDGQRGKTGNGSMSAKINYGGMFKNTSNAINATARMHREAGSYNGFDYDSIRFESRGDAEVVLGALDDMINEYGWATVGALYDLAGVSTNNAQTEKFCWISLTDAKPVRANDGWFLKMPRPTPVD